MHRRRLGWLDKRRLPEVMKKSFDEHIPFDSTCLAELQVAWFADIKVWISKCSCFAVSCCILFKEGTTSSWRTTIWDTSICFSFKSPLSPTKKQKATLKTAGPSSPPPATAKGGPQFERLRRLRSPLSPTYKRTCLWDCGTALQVITQ